MKKEETFEVKHDSQNTTMKKVSKKIKNAVHRSGQQNGSVPVTTPTRCNKAGGKKTKTPRRTHQSKQANQPSPAQPSPRQQPRSRLAQAR